MLTAKQFLWLCYFEEFAIGSIKDTLIYTFLSFPSLVCLILWRLSNTPKPLRFVKGSLRIVLPEVRSIQLESNDSSQFKWTCDTRSQFARHLENILQVTTRGFWKRCWTNLIWLESNYSSQLKLNHHTRSWFARHLENIPQVTTKGHWKCCWIGSQFTRHLEN